MITRCLLIASSALALAGAAAANEPAKSEIRDAAPPTTRPAEVVLASAEQVQPTPQPPQEQAATPAKKPRAARVTSCRCAGQNQR